MGARSRLAVTLTAAAAGAGGCSGKTAGDGAGCRAVEACGGDVVGTWDIMDMCLTEDLASLMDVFEEPGCADVFSGVEWDVAGTYEFGPDGTGTVSGTLSFTMEMRLTERCLSALGAPGLDPEICEELEREFNRMSPAEPEAGIAGATCSIGSAACSCRIFSSPVSLSASGGYRVEGSELVSNGSRSRYCVQDEELTIVTEVDFDGHTVEGVLRARRR